MPENFEALKQTFLDNVRDIVQEKTIPDELVINWDQAGRYFVVVIIFLLIFVVFNFAPVGT